MARSSLQIAHLREVPFLSTYQLCHLSDYERKPRKQSAEKDLSQQHLLSNVFSSSQSVAACKSHHGSGENPTRILVRKLSRTACPTWDTCWKSDQFHVGIYTQRVRISKKAPVL